MGAQSGIIRVGPFETGLVLGASRYLYEDKPNFLEADDVFIDRGMVRKRGPTVDTGLRLKDAVSKNDEKEPVLLIYSFNAKIAGPITIFVGTKSINYIDYSTGSIEAINGYYSTPSENIGTVRHISACHWTTHLHELVFITNGVPYNSALNGIRTVDVRAKTHTVFTPVVTSTVDANGNRTAVDRLLGAQFVLRWGNRLFALATYEGTVGGAPQFFGTKVRYSSNAVGAPTAWENWDPDESGSTGGFFTLGTGDEITSAFLVNNELIILCGSDLYIVSESRAGPTSFNVEQIGNYRSSFSKKSITIANDAGIVAGTEGIFRVETASEKFVITNVDNAISDFVHLSMHADVAGSCFFESNHKRRITYLSYPSNVLGPVPAGSPKYPFVNDKVLVYDWDTSSFTEYDERTTAIGPALYPKQVFKDFRSFGRNVMLCGKDTGEIYFFDEVLMTDDRICTFHVNDIKYTEPKVSRSRMEYAIFEFYTPYTVAQRLKIEFLCDLSVYRTQYIWTVPQDYTMLDVEGGYYDSISTIVRSPRHGISNSSPQRMYVNFSRDTSPLSFNGRSFICTRYSDDEISIGETIPPYIGQQFGEAILSLERSIDQDDFPLNLRVKVLNGGVGATHSIRVTALGKGALALVAIDCKMSTVSLQEY